MDTALVIRLLWRNIFIDSVYSDFLLELDRIAPNPRNIAQFRRISTAPHARKRPWLRSSAAEVRFRIAGVNTKHFQFS